MMNLSCKNCNIQHDILKIRNRLENLIGVSNQNLCSKQIVKLSQFLDNFVYKCTFCRENLNPSNSIIIDDNKLQPKPSNNYDYFNNNHFIVSLYYYITQGLKKNQIIFLSMDKSLYNDTLNIARKLQLPTQDLRFRSIKETILWHANGGLTNLQENIKNLPCEKNMDKYTGFRWISHPKYAIESTSLRDFYSWEMDLGFALHSVNPNSSLKFVYKKYDIKKDNDYIDEPIIDTSRGLDSFNVDDDTFKALEYKFAK